MPGRGCDLQCPREPEMEFGLTPGAFVRHPDQPDWGLGQIQSAIGDRITVNFEHAGKQVINAAVVGLRATQPNSPGP